MHAQILVRAGEPLQARDVPVPEPDRHQLLLQVKACGVCRTDLHVADGELPRPRLPLVLGHEIIGIVAAVGSQAGDFVVGERVGVPWLGWTCGDCAYCRRGQENLCQPPASPAIRSTAAMRNTPSPTRAIAFAFRKPCRREAAPLLCAGLIGYRALRFAVDAKRIGLYGFGAAAHILAQLCSAQGAKSTRSCAAPLRRRVPSHSNLGQSGAAIPAKCRRSNWMPR
jgi:propanol-preferring alcohol dehydrogenase